MNDKNLLQKIKNVRTATAKSLEGGGLNGVKNI